MRKIFWCGAIFLAGVGCSSSTSSDSDLNAWTREVRVITPQQIGDREYEEVANLEERESIGAFGEGNAVSSAKEALRRNAARLDADAVVIIACGENVRPMQTDRPTSMGREVVCQGVAIRWKSN